MGAVGVALPPVFDLRKRPGQNRRKQPIIDPLLTSVRVPHTSSIASFLRLMVSAFKRAKISPSAGETRAELHL